MSGAALTGLRTGGGGGGARATTCWMIRVALFGISEGLRPRRSPRRDGSLDSGGLVASDSRNASLSRILEPVGAGDLRAGDELIDPGASEDSLAWESTLYSDGRVIDTDRGMVFPDL